MSYFLEIPSASHLTPGILLPFSAQEGTGTAHFCSPRVESSALSGLGSRFMGVRFLLYSELASCILGMLVCLCVFAHLSSKKTNGARGFEGPRVQVRSFDQRTAPGALTLTPFGPNSLSWGATLSHF